MLFIRPTHFISSDAFSSSVTPCSRAIRAVSRSTISVACRSIFSRWAFNLPLRSIPV